MSRTTFYLAVVAALCGACGGESNSNQAGGAGLLDQAGGGAVEPSGGATDEPAGTAGDAQGGASGAAGAEAGGTSGSAGSGTAGGGGVQCPDLDCEDCPLGYLEDAQGCGTCVCVVPPVIMETDGVQRDPANVEFGTGSSWAPSSGRVVFSFHWDFDDPAIEDEEHFVNLSIETQDYVLLGMEEVQTFHLPSSDPPFSIEAYRASYISAQAFPLTLIDGYLTIYPSTSTEYSGGVYLVLETAAGVQVIVAGPFDGNEA